MEGMQKKKERMKRGIRWRGCRRGRGGSGGGGGEGCNIWRWKRCGSREETAIECM